LLHKNIRDIILKDEDVEINKQVKVCIYLVAFIFSAMLITSCSDIKRNNTHKDVALSSIEKGKELAVLHCQSCHQLPDPSLVDTKTWDRGILPQMGPRLGIYFYKGNRYPSYKFDVGLSAGYYPSKALVSEEDWQHIIDYYIATSPDTMSTVQHRKRPIQKQLQQFTAIAPPSFKISDPSTCFVKIDTSNPAKPIVISDAFKQVIYRFNTNLEFSDSVKTKGPVVNLSLQNKQWLACNIGVLNPNNGKYGNAQHIVADNNGMKPDSMVIFDNLRRPVQITGADLNNDGKEDYLVCEFGFLEGALSWMENKGTGEFERHVLRPLPGAIQAYIEDYNHDGLKDIWVLFAQAQEGVFLYTNKGNGQFAEEEVLSFLPINGSSYFELADFNKDGHPDLVYTCGDNADYSTVLKPFHGVYIYMNDGNNHFAEKYFFPINGCFKAMARDFDNDGDFDIAAIAYFPDYQHQPEEGFVYLENKGDLDFYPYSLPAAETGRWLTMDAGDYDKDGWTDVILGNFSVAPSFIKSTVDWKNAPSFLVLKNTGKKSAQN
jgi:FG-GAP-like repeat